MNRDIEHYQQIIVALVETDRIMKEIDTLVKWWFFITNSSQHFKDRDNKEIR